MGNLVECQSTIDIVDAAQWNREHVAAYSQIQSRLSSGNCYGFPGKNVTAKLE